VLRGSVDAVFTDDGGTRLVDWKTGLLVESDDQLAFYALLWAADRGELPDRVEAVSIETGERSESVPSRASVDLTTQQVVDVVDALRGGWDSGDSLERVAGPWCRWCPLLDECAEGAAALALLGS
jgi:hypothetical protein